LYFNAQKIGGNTKRLLWVVEESIEDNQRKEKSIENERIIWNIEIGDKEEIICFE